MHVRENVTDRQTAPMQYTVAYLEGRGEREQLAAAPTVLTTKIVHKSGN